MIPHTNHRAVGEQRKHSVYFDSNSIILRLGGHLPKPESRQERWHRRKEGPVVMYVSREIAPRQLIGVRVGGVRATITSTVAPLAQVPSRGNPFE